MPIPRITPEILAKSKSCENGWSLFELLDISSSEAKSGKGVNTYFHFTALSGPGNSEDNVGREISYIVSGSGVEAGISDVVNVYTQLLCALTDSTAEEIVNAEIDEQFLLGKRVWGEVGDRPYEGKMYKEFKTFAPDGATPF